VPFEGSPWQSKATNNKKQNLTPPREDLQEADCILHPLINILLGQLLGPLDAQVLQDLFEPRGKIMIPGLKTTPLRNPEVILGSISGNAPNIPGRKPYN